MLKKDNIKIFVDEVYSKQPLRIYPTSKIIYIHIDEKWSIELADFSDYKTSSIKKIRYIFVIKDKR